MSPQPSFLTWINTPFTPGQPFNPNAGNRVAGDPIGQQQHAIAVNARPRDGGCRRLHGSDCIP